MKELGLKGRDFLTLKDFSSVEIISLIDLALELKYARKENRETKPLAGKSLAMIFEKSSTRTRVSFEAGMYQLGGMAHYLGTNDLQIGRGEPIKDTARVLSRYVDAILIRTFAQETVEELARYADVPVINGLTDEYHPTQVLADFLTIFEYKKKLADIKLTYIGDGNNMANSLLIGGAKLGMEIRIAAPEDYQPHPEIISYAEAESREAGGKIIITTDPQAAAEGADVLYTDTWASMGQEDEAAVRRAAFQGFSITRQLVDLADSEALVMHCLPAYRGEEISAEIMEEYAEIIFNEAENRLHAHKAILAATV